ncbi:MAG: type II secretion system protein [bacterium]|nr:type II secretion system GspH family protein [Mycoplasmatota bacterium]MDD6757109.1 type II secretion system protein [bacterium]MDY2908784.1 type II secretion system protein [Candidatus Faecimonas sp.]
MKKLNRRGFTLVELLAVIVIMGVIMSVAVAAVFVHLSNSRQQAMETIASSAYDGAVMYMMDNNIMLNKNQSIEIGIDQLYAENRIDRPGDPYKTSEECTGSVIVNNKTTDTTAGLEDYQYTVTVNCSGNHKTTQEYPKK